MAMVCVAGCDSGGGSAYPAPPAMCNVSVLDPGDGELTRWPEPDLLTSDPATGTGYRLQMDSGEFQGTIDTAGVSSPILTDDLSDLDGFGVNSQVWFRFSAPFDLTQIPSGTATADPSTGLGLVVLAPSGPYIEPFILRSTDSDSTLMMVPMHPLPEQSTVVAFATKALASAAGGCIWPSRAYYDSIHSADPQVSNAIGALESLGVIQSPDDLVALTVYPTETITDDSVAIAADIASRSYSVDGSIDCTTMTQWRQCEGAFIAEDYRGPDGAIHRNPGDPLTPTTYRLPFTVYLPLAGVATAPFPTILYGHGLGGDRHQAGVLAAFAAPEGIATIAIDAPGHGEHPTVPPGAQTDTLSDTLRFFGAEDLGNLQYLIHSLVLRDHWREATYDKLQLTRLIQQGLDVDGDTNTDLDATRMAYLGVSLGGIMGSELAALTDAYSAVVLVVPGGRVTSIVTDGPNFMAFLPLLAPGQSPDEIQRFMPILQTIVDRGDSASYGPHILQDRLTGSSMPPDLLMGVVLDDDTVPNTSNFTLVRAIGAKVIPPVLRTFPGITMGGTPPVSGNIAGGAATAGVLEFDTIGDGMGGTKMATHSNVGASDVGADAWFQFLMTHWSSPPAVIIDPYTDLGVPHN